MAIEVLDRRACLRLLEDASIGWVAHCAAHGVHMVPVNFAVHEAEIVFRTTYGETLDAVVSGLPLTFGAGAFDDESRSGWSVTVTGSAHLAGDPLVNPGLADADVWAELPQTVPVRLLLTTVSGRRVQADGTTAGGYGRPARRP